MAKILVLASRIPYPVIDGARVRIYNTALALAEHHEVTLLVVDNELPTPETEEHLSDIFSEFHSFRVSTPRSYLNSARGVMSKLPLQTFYFRSRSAEKWIDQNVSEYDLLYANHARTTEYAREYDVPKIVDLVDALSKRYGDPTEHVDGFWKLIYPIEARRLNRYEQVLAGEFDRTLLISPEDKRAISDATSDGPIHVLPNGVKQQLFDLPIDRAEEIVLFHGKMDYAPNVEGATHLVEDIFPQIREQRPDAKCYIVGISPTESVRQLQEREGVVVTGKVDDMSEYLERAALEIAPIRHGTGVQNKVLEGMAAATPVITTPIGAEGIEANPGEHLLVETDDGEIASRAVQLLGDESKRQELGYTGRKCMKELYTWDSIGEKLNRIVDETLA